MSSTIEAVRAEALFVSSLQSSQPLADAEVRATVARTLQRFGIRACATQVAGEFGDHPEAAAARMAWALATVRSAYAARRRLRPATLAA